MFAVVAAGHALDFVHKVRQHRGMEAPAPKPQGIFAAFYQRVTRRFAAHRIINRRLQSLEDRIGVARVDLVASERRVAELSQRLDEARVRAEFLQTAVGEAHRHLEVLAVMEWIAAIDVAPGPLVTVILPTRNRRAWLERAVASVETQSYANWELVAIDDGSTDGTTDYLQRGLGDRVRYVRTEGGGVCAARNAGLRVARGELIAYLDDDNIMHPHWLKSIVWAFGGRPEVDTLYGAFVVDDTQRINRVGRGDLPRLYYRHYDHDSIARDNIADIGCIAHRAGIAESHFDESLREMGDWDLFLRLTRHRPPLGLPAIACFYSTDAPDRLSNGPTFEADMIKVRSKNQR